VRSVTMHGQQETTNIIERVELYDRDTNQLLQTFKKNQASSADVETYDFEFDLSSYFTLASSRKFKLVAYDDSDNNGSRNINVTAVDVTIKSEQTLNYTSSTFVTVGGNAKSLPMYKFPNNTSDKGILCTVEMFIGNQWKTIGTATITDSFQKSISINPKNCAGSVLTHGAYPIRIHGVDVASGVVGNYLYTTVFVIEQGNTTPRRYSLVFRRRNRHGKAIRDNINRLRGLLAADKLGRGKSNRDYRHDLKRESEPSSIPFRDLHLFTESGRNCNRRLCYNQPLGQSIDTNLKVRAVQGAGNTPRNRSRGRTAHGGY